MGTARLNKFVCAVQLDHLAGYVPLENSVEGGGDRAWQRGRVDAETGVEGGVRPRFATIDEVMMTRCTLGVLSAEESRPADVLMVGSNVSVMGSKVGMGTGEPAWMTCVTPCRAASNAPSAPKSGIIAGDRRPLGASFCTAALEETVLAFSSNRVV